MTWKFQVSNPDSFFIQIAGWPSTYQLSHSFTVAWGGSLNLSSPNPVTVSDSKHVRSHGRGLLAIKGTLSEFNITHSKPRSSRLFFPAKPDGRSQTWKKKIPESRFWHRSSLKPAGNEVQAFFILNFVFYCFREHLHSFCHIMSQAMPIFVIFRSQ